MQKEKKENQSKQETTKHSYSLKKMKYLNYS